MTKRIVTKVGDIFCIKIDDEHKRYFQYVISDLTCLNSDVIRVFKKQYLINENPVLTEIVKDEVDFYSHCVTSAGIKRELWKKIGNIKDVGETKNIIFKCKADYTSKDIDNDWIIWKINENIIHIGKLSEEYNENVFLGEVFPPDDIVCRIKTGSYIGTISDFE